MLLSSLKVNGVALCGMVWKSREKSEICNDNIFIIFAREFLEQIQSIHLNPRTPVRSGPMIRLVQAKFLLRIYQLFLFCFVFLFFQLVAFLWFFNKIFCYSRNEKHKLGLPDLITIGVISIRIRYTMVTKGEIGQGESSKEYVIRNQAFFASLASKDNYDSTK